MFFDIKRKKFNIYGTKYEVYDKLNFVKDECKLLIDSSFSSFSNEHIKKKLKEKTYKFIDKIYLSIDMIDQYNEYININIRFDPKYFLSNYSMKNFYEFVDIIPILKNCSYLNIKEPVYSKNKLYIATKSMAKSGSIINVLKVIREGYCCWKFGEIGLSEIGLDNFFSKRREEALEYSYTMYCDSYSFEYCNIDFVIKNGPYNWYGHELSYEEIDMIENLMIIIDNDDDDCRAILNIARSYHNIDLIVFIISRKQTSKKNYEEFIKTLDWRVIGLYYRAKGINILQLIWNRFGLPIVLFDEVLEFL